MLRRSRRRSIALLTLAMVLSVGGLTIVSAPAQAMLPRDAESPWTPSSVAPPTPAKPRQDSSTPAKLPNPSNPLVGGPWAVYHGNQDGVWPAYERASGATKTLLGKVALNPRVRWYHSGVTADKLAGKLRSEIAEQTASDQNALVQIAWFYLWPHGEGARNRPLSRAEQADYRHKVDIAVDVIGRTRMAIVLEPDLALTAPPMRKQEMSTADAGVRQSLVAYAAKRFSSLPRTAVYLDAGDADWLTLEKATSVLRNSGVQYARGFALGAIHYGSVPMEVSYGVRLRDALESAGLGEKHFVIDTADNGKAFTFPEYYTKHPRGNFDNAEPCGSLAELRCDTLGHAPTWDTGVDGVGLTDLQRQQAATYVDAYLWFGRPWLVNQAAPFSLARTLQVARSTPYDQTNVTSK